MDSKKLAYFKHKLLDEQARLESLIERTAKHLYRREEPYDADFAEQAIEVSNNEVVEHLDQDAKRDLALINKALAKFEDGNYGLCETCEQPIKEQRLKVLPHTPFCINCA